MAAHSQSVITMANRHPSVARLMRIRETLPAELKVEFLRLDPTWIWVVDGVNGIEGCLIAAPGPGIAILLKISTIKLASPNVIVKLLRKSLTDMYNRGYYTYMVCLDPDRPLEKKLLRIVGKSGGMMMGKGIIFAGKTDIGGL